MVEEDGYCVDILMQLSAATGALDRVGEIVLDNHLRTCVNDALQGDDEAERQAKIDELMAVFRRYRK